jgi:ATP-dependent RNA helicase RhlE
MVDQHPHNSGNSEGYVHRVGRTGRGRLKEQAVSFCSPDEEKMLRKIESIRPKAIDGIDISKNDYPYTIEQSIE